ncbi:MAG: NAD-dependent epimerase/dehydratase family protein [Solirubrobacteraceae bacterium]
MSTRLSKCSRIALRNSSVCLANVSEGQAESPGDVRVCFQRATYDRAAGDGESVTILVTGATGFIGRHLVAHLRGNGATMIGASRHAYRDDRGEYEVADVTQLREVEQLFARTEPTVVVHLAAAIPDGALSDRNCFELCVAGSLAVVEACRSGGVPLVHASSTAVYGQMTGSVRREDAFPAPDSLYGAGKLVGDVLVAELTRSAGVPACALRISAPYGPGNARSSVVNRFLLAALRAEDIPLHGIGSREQDFTYVGDVVAAIECAVSRQASGVFNIATGSSSSMLELAEAVLRAVPGTGSRIVPTGDADPQEGYRAALDVGKARGGLGWSAQVSLDEGLRATADWLARSEP